MALVRSLVCFGGRTGKTVALSIASPCVATLTYHGLRNGAGVAFSTTGALPTGLVAGTTYHARSTGNDTFNLYDTQAHAVAGGATGLINTSGSQSGAHTVKGAYFQGLTAAQLARYGASGSERIYDGLSAWVSARAGANSIDEELCELGEAFIEYINSLNFNIPSAVMRVESMVSGVRTSAFHDGVVDTGFVLAGTNAGAYNYVTFAAPYVMLADGWTIAAPSGHYGAQGLSVAGEHVVMNMLIGPLAGGTCGTPGIDTANGRFENVVVYGHGRGFSFPTYASAKLRNCTSARNNYGFFGETYAPTNVSMYNCVAIANTTADWSAGVYGVTGTNNAGAVGTPWGTSPVTVATTDFVNTAARDFRPASGSSPVVDAGVEVYGLSAFDVQGHERPSYNNGGAEATDIGAYEFDRGFGVHPASCVITFQGVNAGSEIRVYLPDGSEAAGVEACDADHVLTWAVFAPGSPDNTVRIVIVHPNYRIKEFTYTASAGVANLPAQQEPDKWYSNP